MSVDLSSFLSLPLEQSLAAQQQVLAMTLRTMMAPRRRMTRMRTRDCGQTVSSQCAGSSQYSHEAAQERPQSREDKSEAAESCLIFHVERNVLKNHEYSSRH